jgi:hypothetical protein
MFFPTFTRHPKQRSRGMKIGLGISNIAVTEEGRKYRKQRTGVLPRVIEARQCVGCE